MLKRVQHDVKRKPIRTRRVSPLSLFEPRTRGGIKVVPRSGITAPVVLEAGGGGFAVEGWALWKR